MRKATHPGTDRKKAVLAAADRVEKKWLANTSDQLSKHRLTMMRQPPMRGESQKMVAAGLLRPILSSFSRRCVRLHRRPLRALALVMRMNPSSSNWASVATIINTPMKMRKMTPTSRKEKTSSLKAKAKTKTKISEDDLHMAEYLVRTSH